MRPLAPGIAGRLSWRMVFAGCLAGGLFWASLGLESGVAQPPAAPPHATAEAERYIGVVQCARCHARPGPLDDQNGSTRWVSLTEYHTWSTQDKHAKAHATLASSASSDIGARLGLKDVTLARECLSCHCNLRTDVWPSADGWPSELDRSQGVSCEACHGPGADYDQPHRQPSWRVKTAAEKQQLGMVDVRDPRARAAQCLTCHVGDVSQGKVVTHAMYAAGHPPLPGIEIETFSQNMPRHWRNLAEKPADLPNRALIEQQLRQRDGELPGARSVVLSAAMTFRAAARLLAEQALDSASAGGPPEFSQFDCRACHHELQPFTPHAGIDLTGRPGRPRLRSWPTALAEVAIKHASQGDTQVADTLLADYRDRLAAMHASFAASPFGKPSALGDPADANSPSGRMLAWIDADLLDALEQPACDASAARSLLRSICEVALERDLDYDSARQLAWAFRTIDLELRPDADERDPLRVCLAELAERLVLDLPWTQQQEIFDHLPHALQAAGAYDPADARRAFAKLRALLRER